MGYNLVSMAVTEIRAFPVNSTIVMRSTLFALANQGATLQTYNEETGFIVATVSRWLGLQKKEVVARVRAFENTCQLELDAPDVDKARELLQLISTYVRDGARVQANATIQWVDLQRQQANKAKRRELSNKARNLITGGQPADPAADQNTTTTAVAVVENDPAQALALNDEIPVSIPDNPGVLVKNRENMIIELKVDPQVFTDRSGFVVNCNVCQAPALRGSSFCPNCGRPLTLEAVQPELRQNAERSANSGLTYGMIGLALSLVPLLVLVLPALLATPSESSLLDRIRETLQPLTIALSVVLGILPAMLAGWFALRQGQRAVWYQNLPSMLEHSGRSKSAIGNALGWLSIYISVGWILLIVIALL